MVDRDLTVGASEFAHRADGFSNWSMSFTGHKYWTAIWCHTAKMVSLSPELTGGISMPGQRKWWLREIIAILVWAMAFVKLFVCDIDLLILQSTLPSHTHLLQYRFFAIIGITSALWVTLGNRRFRVLVGYILFYPFILTLLHVPVWLFRHWAIAVAFYPAIHNHIVQFRRNFVMATIMALSLLAIALSESHWILHLAMSLLAMCLGIHFLDRIRMTCQPSSVLADLRSMAHRFWQYMQEKGILTGKDKLDKLTLESSDYERQRAECVYQDFFTTWTILVLAERIRELAISRMLDIYLIGSLLFSVTFTVLVFSAEYWSLYKIDADSFTPSHLTWWDFVGYSFGTIMTSDIGGISPVSSFAKCIAYAEIFCGLLLLVILVFSLLTIERERYRAEFDDLIEFLKSMHGDMAMEFEKSYKMSLNDAEIALLLSHEKAVNQLRVWRGLAKLPRREAENARNADTRPRESSPLVCESKVSTTKQHTQESDFLD
ncbi:MAG: hypothetical protein JNM18_15000 [Planctomycetaceae bacterium]|nr:hypothetical protein [Planctomycetaceae bacterium]